MNQLQAVAMNEEVRRKKAPWSKSGASPVRVAFAGSPGGTAPARLTGAVGSIEPDDRGVKRSRGAASQAPARGVAPNEASWRGTYYRPCLRADRRLSGARLKEKGKEQAKPVSTW